MNADVNATDAAEETALHIFARNMTKPGKDSLGLLVKAGAKLEAKNVAGDTALIVAGKALNLESAKLLIKSGANVRAVDSKGESVVFGFARAGDIEALIALNKLGVDLRPVAPIVGKHVRLKHFFRKLFKKKSSKKSI
jgi:ankyrin repeat protein